MSNYCIAKAGLEMLTRSLAAEQRGDRFRAITVRPGIIDTGMQEYMRSRPKEVLPAWRCSKGFTRAGNWCRRTRPPQSSSRSSSSAPVENGRTYTYQELAA